MVIRRGDFLLFLVTLLDSCLFLSLQIILGDVVPCVLVDKWEDNRITRTGARLDLFDGGGSDHVRRCSSSDV